MKIQKIVTQNRRDFTAIYKCEHCGGTHEAYGYDDAHFHQNVIPKMKCPKCKKIADIDYSPLTTKHPAGMTV